MPIFKQTFGVLSYARPLKKEHTYKQCTCRALFASAFPSTFHIWRVSYACLCVAGFSNKTLQGAEGNVRVNAVAPGHVVTGMYAGVSDEALAGVIKNNQLIERPLKSEEVR